MCVWPLCCSVTLHGCHCIACSLFQRGRVIKAHPRDHCFLWRAHAQRGVKATLHNPLELLQQHCMRCKELCIDTLCLLGGLLACHCVCRPGAEQRQRSVHLLVAAGTKCLQVHVRFCRCALLHPLSVTDFRGYHQDVGDVSIGLLLWTRHGRTYCGYWG